MKQGDSTPYRVKHVRRCDWCVNIAFAVGVVGLGLLVGVRFMLVWLFRCMLFSVGCGLLVGIYGLALGTIHQLTKNKKQL